MVVKKIKTFKSGNFAFSNTYSYDEIKPLEIELRLLFKSLKELPILPKQAQIFENELIHRSIFSTAAIEGNPLRENEVVELINNSQSEVFGERRNVEILNLSKAYDAMASITQENKVHITEAFISEIHKLVTVNLSYDSCIPGHYRNHIVKVGDKEHGGVATPPKCLADIKKLMNFFGEWFQSKEIQSLPIVIQSAIAHYHLALIHPFADGNGRVARLIEAAILRSDGIKYLPTMLSSYYYREINEYFIAFSQCRKNKGKDITPFIKFVLNGAVESLEEVKKHITANLRQATLGVFFEDLVISKKITKRQLELLNLLLNSSKEKEITISSIQRELPFRTLYARVSDRTARRDLGKLHDLDLIKEKDGKFCLDREILNAL